MLASHLLGIVLIFAVGQNEADGENKENDDDGDVDSRVVHEVSVTEHVVPVDGVWDDDKTPRESG